MAGRDSKQVIELIESSMKRSIRLAVLWSKIQDEVDVTRMMMWWDSAQHMGKRK